MRHLTCAMAVLVACVCCVPAQAPEGAPRVALIYSDYGDFRHRDDYDGRMGGLGWPMDKYENTQFADLAAKLGQYDLVIGSALYNYANVQDFSQYRDQMIAFMERGGAFVFTDVNYAVHVDWLNGFGDGYGVAIEACEHAGTPAGPTEPDHPLMNLPGKWSPTSSWTHMTVGPEWRVLARCPHGRDLWALSDFGKGFLWLSSFWPLSETQLRDLWEYLRMRRAGVEITAAKGLEDLHPGVCRAEVSFRELAEEAEAPVVSWCVLQPDGQVAQATGRTVAREGGFVGRFELKLDQRGKYASWLRIARDGRRLYESTPVQVEVPDLIEAELLRPAYREALYLSAAPRELRVRVTPYPYGEDLRDTELSVSGRQGTKTVAQVRSRLSRNPGARQDVCCEMIGLEPGTLEVRAVVTKGERVLWRKRWHVDVIAAREPQVALGDRLQTYVDGEPFFPIGMYHIGEASYDRARKMGINCVQVWGGSVEQALKNLDTAGEHGLKVILEMSPLLRGEYKPELFREVVRACRDHPALLAWYPVDEPSGEQYEWCLDAYGICREEDPHHPVYLVMCNPPEFRRFAATTDVLAIDPYPIPAAPLKMVASWCRAAADALEERRAFWLIPQLHNPAAYGGDASKGRGPTPQEEWCMVAQGLIYGAKGIVYYPWDDTRCGLVHEPALMEELPRINRFLAQWGNTLAASQGVLLAGLGLERDPEASDGVHAAVFEGDSPLLVATNVGPDAVETQISFDRRYTRARSLLDEREWQLEDWAIRLRLEPAEVVAAELAME